MFTVACSKPETRHAQLLGFAILNQDRRKTENTAGEVNSSFCPGAGSRRRRKQLYTVTMLPHNIYWVRPKHWNSLLLQCAWTCGQSLRKFQKKDVKIWPPFQQLFDKLSFGWWKAPFLALRAENVTFWWCFTLVFNDANKDTNDNNDINDDNDYIWLLYYDYDLILYVMNYCICSSPSGECKATLLQVSPGFHCSLRLSWKDTWWRWPWMDDMICRSMSCLVCSFDHPMAFTSWT